jgi:KipI family sensor histidine kinase inhibitor
VRPVGDHAVLLELDDNASVHAAARIARERLGDQLSEIVPGDRTLLLVWPDGSTVSDISELALERASSEISDDDAARPEAVVIPVRYDGADLEAVAAQLALSSKGVVELHSGALYTVGFMGFAPGFPYLVAEAGDEALRLLELPRLGTPRTEVPVGSVAVAAGYCGIYPRSTPGGWNLLGRTDVVLFDAERAAPALLEPGARVRFEAV